MMPGHKGFTLKVSQSFAMLSKVSQGSPFFRNALLLFLTLSFQPAPWVTYQEWGGFPFRGLKPRDRVKAETICVNKTRGSLNTKEIAKKARSELY
jgi:hypothetical protein